MPWLQCGPGGWRGDTLAFPHHPGQSAFLAPPRDEVPKQGHSFGRRTGCANDDSSGLGVFRNHKVIQLSKEARELFVAFQAGWNVQAAVQRTTGPDGGRLGTASWQLAALSCANLIFEVASGDVTPQPGQELEVQSRHVIRAHSEVVMSHGVISLWRAESPPKGRVNRPDYGPLASTLSSAERLQAACQAAPVPSQVPIFEATQLPPVKQESEDSGAVPASGPQDTAQPRVLRLGDPEVPALTQGYGENFESVQNPALGPVVHPDRVA